MIFSRGWPNDISNRFFKRVYWIIFRTIASITSRHIILVYAISYFCRPSLKSALRPPPSAWAESANFRPFYVKRADFSPPPPATKKRRKLVKIRPRCLHLATKKRRKVVKLHPCGTKKYWQKLVSAKMSLLNAKYDWIFAVRWTKFLRLTQ